MPQTVRGADPPALLPLLIDVLRRSVRTLNRANAICVARAFFEDILPLVLCLLMEWNEVFVHAPEATFPRPAIHPGK